MSKIDHNSIVNQDIKRKLVDREVCACVTSMVEYIIKKGLEDPDAPFTLEDIENYYQPICPECGDTVKKDDDTDTYKCVSCDWESEDEPDSEPQEIYEWWFVTDWLCDKLAEMGEPVLKNENIWGRGTSGQAILLDYVISKIAEDMGILEG